MENKNLIYKITTHSGIAHTDELCSIALLMADPDLKIKVIERVPAQSLAGAQPTQNEIWVDVGQKYDPAGRAFDHHQLNAEEYTSAFNLVLDYYFDGLKEWEEFFPQFKFIGVKDTNGPKAAYEFFNVTMGANTPIVAFQSLVEEALLSYLQSKNEFILDDDAWFFQTLKMIGSGIREKIMDTLNSITLINSMASVMDNNCLVIDSVLPKGSQIITDKYIRDNKLKIDFLISRSSQDPKSWSAIRRSAQYDLRNLQSSEDVTFCHASGFMAVFKEGTSIDRIIKALKRL